MRVWELARDLGRESSELLAELQGLGFDVSAPASGLSDEDVEAIQKAYAALAPASAAETAVASPEAPGSSTRQTDGHEAAGEAAREAGGAPAASVVSAAQPAQARRRRYRLVGKASVSAGNVVVRRTEGEAGTISEAQHATLPGRVKKFFKAE